MVAMNKKKSEGPSATAFGLIAVFLVWCVWMHAKDSCGGRASDLDLLAATSRGLLNVGTGDRPNVDAKAIADLFSQVSPARLKEVAFKYREEYSEAKPFPHIAIDNIFPDSILERVMQENPESLLTKGCLSEDRCFRGEEENLKSFITDEEMMGVHSKILLNFLISTTFIEFLQELTGIAFILPDPTKTGSGFHFTAPGGQLDIHADFNWHDDYKLNRRVNVFIYLNENWPEQFGGHLELWSRDMKSCMKSILPSLGRLVVFSTTDFSYHGHPQPLPAPKGRARRSIAMYYYTHGRPDTECLTPACEPGGTLFQKPQGCSVCRDEECLSFNPDQPQWVDANFK